VATVVTVIAVGLALAAATGPWGDSPRVNVVLVSIDTLRADHLGCYGYGPPTSPWIDAFSQEALLYEESIAAAPSTLASHASMLTSLVVPHHGASVARGTGLASAHLTLAEVLREYGYATASWNGGGQLDELYQLDQGFGLYHSAPRRTRPRSTPPVDRLDRAVTKGLEWIDGLAFGRPFFLFLHSYEVHSPYVPDPKLRALFGRTETRLTDAVLGEDLERLKSGEWTLEPGDLQHVIACYDAEIRSADRAFGRLVDSLKERELLDSTVVVLTSDHGEEFGEHGVVGWHSHTLFDELLRVPFLVRPPGGHPWGERVRHQVAGIDLAPTILDAVGIDAPPVFEGRSVLGLTGTTAPIPERPVLSARDLDPLRTKRRLHRISLRSDGWKWIAEDRYRRRDQEWQWIQGGRLLDLRRDPGETTDVRKVRPENRARERAMRGRATSWEVARRPVTEQVIPPSDLLKQLRALGYMR
jgi:arylsulfatase A-like enzyme